MKKTFLFSLGLILAFSSLFVSCIDNNGDNDKNSSLICQISVSNTDGGSAKITNYIGSSANVLIGNGVEVVATPDNGYNFLGWYLGNSDVPVSTDAVFTFTASKDIALIAKFEKSFAISVKSSGNGTVSFKDIVGTSLNSVLKGTELTVIAVPDEKYDFLGWFVGNSNKPISTEATYTFTVAENVTLVAKFKVPLEAVDLGLSVKWANYNVGATSPEDYGYYYAWGEIEEKSNYDWSTYKWCNGSENTMTKYCTDSSYGTGDNKTTLDLEDDVAHVKWGGDWRMPTKAEQDELLNNCTWQWTTLNGVNGYRVTGPNGNSIFLPAAGFRGGTGIHGRGYRGVYWSSSLYSYNSGNAYVLYFYDDSYDWNNYRSCYIGCSVRPVCK
jgi:hypothetical protein